ncbi:sigma-70 family RNA polymerase sigma factor [Polaromonas sp. YR568]|uniref:RNA polymerase sigma factor n=1 Tax=Polaromonas sp. YR568 TaxID=1855301 RepID=UPI0031381957
MISLVSVNVAVPVGGADDVALARAMHLVTLAAAGDSAAFDVLVKEHYQLVFRFQMKWVRHQAVAEELAQETFFAAWKKIPGFRKESKFSTWLLGIALNLARNHRNRGPARHEVELPDDDHLEVLLGADEAPEEQLGQRQMLTALDKALARLPADMREVTVLVRLEGMALQDVAKLLDVPMGTVKSRLSRARAQLALELKEYLA